ncbi:(2Fe-2S) ferredoxin domain-containing protein [Picosynechococcus sp. PCC 7117]|uniref:(2Fe-2S) ferredoxin domain-containing protein n=1 Tax=Picosynechococcus sp. PCC 7117 TaxID=195498 RepID=UPI000810DA42|nr:(2Fe-2S) ferredoxin domain-containing protein [Picosynechococcus sp. PCC 7117]ANV87493.1 hypothetical protein AWQ22_08505 [Picosynechococcus sp. PCC 7117]
MITLAVHHRSFTFVGTASNFKLGKHQRIRHFDLQTDHGSYRFKIPSKLHKRLHFQLELHSKLEVRGIIWRHPKKSKEKLEIQHIALLSESQGATPNESFGDRPLETADSTGNEDTNIAENPCAKTNGPQKIVLCKKPTCWKRGGQLIYDRLQQAIRDQDIADQVSIETTGCMGRCKKAPNLMVMPDKQKYSNFPPNAAADLIHHHFQKHLDPQFLASDQII